jgi:hypothetical protein
VKVLIDFCDFIADTCWENICGRLIMKWTGKNRNYFGKGSLPYNLFLILSPDYPQDFPKAYVNSVSTPKERFACLRKPEQNG